MLCTWHLIFHAFHCKYRKARNRHRWRRNRHIHASSHDSTVQGSDSTSLRRRASISSPSGSEYSIFGQRGFPVSFSLSHSLSLLTLSMTQNLCHLQGSVVSEYFHRQPDSVVIRYASIRRTVIRECNLA